MTDTKTLKHVNDALKAKFKGRKLVFGQGVVGAKIAFVSEMLSADAAKVNSPLGREHAKVLNKLLRNAGINKRKVYVTNVVKYCPERDKMPTPKEIKAHAMFLREELKTVSPQLVVTLGNLALNGVGVRMPLDNVHGRLFNLGSYELMPTYHPEHALRDPIANRLLETDFARLRDLLKEKTETVES